MIEIFNEINEKVGSFQSYNGLFKYIREREKETLIRTGQTDWRFTIHGHERLSCLYWRAIKALDTLFTEKEMEAFNNELNLLEMCMGDYDNPTQIILTPDINVKEIRKNWCRDYCLEHGYIFSETKQ